MINIVSLHLYSSISSSPLLNPTTASITLSVLKAPVCDTTDIKNTYPTSQHMLETPKRNHLGVASTYLASLQPSDPIHVSVRPSHTAFHLPADPYATPIIMVAAGSGIAPFMGFLQERAALLATTKTLAPAVLYYGCRSPTHDAIYASELAAYEAQGIVTIRRAYSLTPYLGFMGKSRYVQDAMSADRDGEALDLWREGGARMYICGSKRVGDGVRGVAIGGYVDVVGRERGLLGEGKGEGEGEREEMDELRREAEVWWEGMRDTRYATDVFD